MDLSKAYGAQQVLAGASFRLLPNERLALVGPNGAGKTTLLRLLAGEETPDGGTLQRPRGLQVGYLPQEIDVSSPLSLRAYVEDVAADLRGIEADMREAEERMGAGDADPALLEWYGHLRTRFEHLDGYTLGARAERILGGLGFQPGDFARPLQEFSGGWRMRAALARILLREPELVLLDEPTNHLDIDSLEWLESYLREARGNYLMVSHDAAFLDRVVDGVLALESGGVVRVKGNYTRYREQRALRDAQAWAAHDNFQRKRAAEQQFVDRFRSKATKARQVQSRLRRMEKAEPPPPPPERGAVLALSLPQPARSGRTVLTLEGVELGYEGKPPVHRNLTFRLERGDKAVLIGPNGAGKSTLLKALAGVLAPRAGRVTVGHQVTVSYFAQHQLEQLDPRRTVLEEMARVPGLTSELQMRSLLGAFLFSGDAVEKPVAVLSGGEKSRLVLARLLAAPGNLLLMDEPTNHLDLQACEVLKQALTEFQGTVCLITHDRDLIDRVATRVLYLDGQGVTEYLGNYQDYLARRAVEQAAEQRDRPAAAEAGGSDRKEQRRRDAERRQQLQRETGHLRRRVEELEEEVAAAEARLAAVEAELAAPETYQSPPRAAALARERAELVARAAAGAAAWEAAATELEEREAAVRQEWQGSG